MSKTGDYCALFLERRKLDKVKFVKKEIVNEMSHMCGQKILIVLRITINFIVHSLTL